MPWKVDFYEEKDGTCPVEEFLTSLPDKHVGKVLQVIQLLEEWGPILPFPFSSQIEGRLRELRIQYGKSNYRILYYGDASRAFILLHAFLKQTEKTPEGEKRLALKRMLENDRNKARKGGKA